MQPRGLLRLLFPILLAGPLAAFEAPLTVSPGHPEVPLSLPTSCPPMSWTLVDGALGYELAVFRLTDSETLASSASEDSEATEWERLLGDPVLQQTLPAGAGFWSPASHQCLQAGPHVWAVRAQGADGWSDWSPPAFFSIPGQAALRHPPRPSVAAPAEQAIEPAGPEDVVFRADGLIESTADGFRFPDGSEQKKAFTREVFHVAVAADGTKLAGNVTSTTKEAGTGVYSVNLGRLGFGCAAVGGGGVYDPPDTPFIVPRIDVATVVDPASLSISVYTWDGPTGAAVDAAFHLIVVCPPFTLFR